MRACFGVMRLVAKEMPRNLGPGLRGGSSLDIRDALGRQGGSARLGPGMGWG